MISYAKKVLTMSNTSSTADRSSKRKRNNNVESGQRRSLRCVPGDSVTSSSKRTDVDTLGSCLSDKDEYFTRKEDKKTLQVTFTCNTTNETFDSLAEAGEHFLKNEQYVFQWMEEGLAGDEMVEEALISLARGGNKDAIRICEGNDIDIEEEEEEGVGMPVKSTKKEEENDDDAEDEEGAEAEDDSPFGLSKAGYGSASLDTEKEKSKMEMGALLSGNTKRAIVLYLGIGKCYIVIDIIEIFNFGRNANTKAIYPSSCICISCLTVLPMEQKLTELNATTTEEINGLNEQIKNDSPHKEKKRIKAAVDKKIFLRKCRTSFHKKQVVSTSASYTQTCYLYHEFCIPTHSFTYAFYRTLWLRI